MKKCSALHELLKQDARSRAMYDKLPRDVQVELQEQRQSICSYEELAQAVEGFEKRMQN